MKNRISLIVATKDRPDDLQRLLQSLRLQTVPPNEVIVVDASADPIESVVQRFPELKTRYLRHCPPSASAQRNVGIRACDPASTLIGFADDDTTFEKQAFQNMLSFWDIAAPDVLGASFNIRNYPPRSKAILKHSRVAEFLGLYSSRPGSVSPSGWQTVTGEVAETLFVQWIPSTAALFRREVFDRVAFDEIFHSYSYLEDLDLSYSISRMGRLAIVAGAGYFHFPSQSGRISARQFGRFEVRNRLYFVHKHKLSVVRCYTALMVRLTMTLTSGLVRGDRASIDRVSGNCMELSTSGLPWPNILRRRVRI